MINNTITSISALAVSILVAMFIAFRSPAPFDAKPLEGKIAALSSELDKLRSVAPFDAKPLEGKIAALSSELDKLRSVAD
jgi:hypothetical protein